MSPFPQGWSWVPDTTEPPVPAAASLQLPGSPGVRTVGVLLHSFCSPTGDFPRSLGLPLPPAAAAAAAAAAPADRGGWDSGQLSAEPKPGRCTSPLEPRQRGGPSGACSAPRPRSRKT